MSSGYPIEDTHYHQYPQKQIVVIDTEKKMNNEYDDIDNNFDEDGHAVGLNYASQGEQVARIAVRVCGSPAQLQNNGGVLSVFKLSTEMVHSLKLPNVLTGKNGVALDERTGDPKKTIFKSVVVKAKKNTFGFPVVAEIDGLKKTIPTKNGPANVYLSAGINRQTEEDISEPNNVVTEKMLLMHNPLEHVKKEITFSSDTDYEFGTLKVKNKDESYTFTAALLTEMCDNGIFPKLNFRNALAKLKDERVDVDAKILMRVRDECEVASKQINDSLINMHDWTVTFRRYDSNSFINDTAPVNGIITRGHQSEDQKKKKKKTSNAVNATVGEMELELEITYGMLDN